MKARKIISSYSSVELPALQRELSRLLSDGDTITIGSRSKKTVPIRYSYLGYVGKRDYGRVAAAVERGRRIVELEKVIAELTDLSKTEN